MYTESIFQAFPIICPEKNFKRQSVNFWPAIHLDIRNYQKNFFHYKIITLTFLKDIYFDSKASYTMSLR